MRKELEKRLKKQHIDLEAVGKEIITLQATKTAIEAVICELESLLKTLPKENGKAEQEKQLRHGTDVFKARQALRTAGKALYIDDIITAMSEEPTIERRRSLAGQIAAYVRDNQIFTRPAPNTFGLKEFEDKKIEQETEDGYADFQKIKAELEDEKTEPEYQF